MFIKQLDATSGADWRAGPPAAVKVAWSVKLWPRGLEDGTGENGRYVTSRRKRVREVQGVRPSDPSPLRRGNYVSQVSSVQVVVWWPSYKGLCHSMLWRDDLSSINGTGQSGRLHIT